jgi:hypothetical protein
MSGATAGSGGAEGAEENEGRLMLPHAPSNTASAEAIPRLTTVRVLDLIMASPKAKIVDRIRPAAKRKTAVGAMTSS